MEPEPPLVAPLPSAARKEKSMSGRLIGWLLTIGTCLVVGTTTVADFNRAWPWWMNLPFVIGLICLTIGGFAFQRRLWRALSRLGR